MSKNRLLTTIAWGVGGRVEYALEGSIFNAGSAIKWLRDDLGLISSAREIDALAESVPDTGGAYFVSAFTGLGAPHWDMYARGAMLGITRATTKAHFARAVLEGIAFQVCDLVKTMEMDAGVPLAELKVDGGASVSNIMMQMQADLLDARVNRPKLRGVHGARRGLPGRARRRCIRQHAGYRRPVGERTHLFSADRRKASGNPACTAGSARSNAPWRGRRSKRRFRTSRRGSNLTERIFNRRISGSILRY